MELPLVIAVRYISGRKSFHFITIITFISIVGIAVGVAALIIVMSIFNGFRELTEKQIVGFDPHIQLVVSGQSSREIDSRFHGNDRTTEATEELKDSVFRVLSKISNIQSAIISEQVKVAIIRKSAVAVVNLKLIDDGRDKGHRIRDKVLETDGYFNEIAKTIRIGKFDLSDTASLPGIVPGIAIGDRLHAFPGDTVFILSPEMIEKSILTYRQQTGAKAIVRGLFQTNIRDYDYIYGFASTRLSPELKRKARGNDITYDIKLKSLAEVDETSRELKNKLGRNIIIKTWKDLNKDLYMIMEFERMASFIILSLIVFISVFNVLASLAMTVTEKQKDIAILKSIGAVDKIIYRTYLLEGSFIGLIGTFAGTLLSILLILGQSDFHWLKVDSTKYVIDYIPVSLYITDIIFVCIVSIALSFLATLYPARKAARSAIVESLGSE